MLMAWPMTPVEATMTSSGAMPSSAASSSQVFSAMYSPLALQVLALPLLQITAPGHAAGEVPLRGPRAARP